jgi:iron complex transport system substrate-binding protein
LADPLFQQLKASKDGRILFFGLTDPTYGALSFSTVTSLSYLVDQLVPQLVAAADGDPATVVKP